MKSTFPKAFLTLIIIIISISAFAQNGSNLIWQETVKPNTNQSKNPLLKFYPEQDALYYQLNIDELKRTLENAPKRETIANRNSNVILQFPNSKGVFESYRIVEASTMTPELQQLYPNIRSYAGQGIDNPSAIIRFSLSLEKGLSSMVLSDVKTVFIEPFTDDLNTYIVYIRSASETRSSFVCETEYVESRLEDFDVNEYRNANDGLLRTFRLALACTGEYAQFHGGTNANVMAAMNTTMTRVNGVFERDVALTMVMVPNASIIFLNGATDPYNNGNGGAMLGQNQTECDNNIGSANYDIGHVFSTGGGGVAYLRSPCNNSIKAGGVTGQGAPVGDTFDIDYVAHEMGHQYGGNHTQNNPCNSSVVSVEPGSASTIMGYAGICAPNVQGNSDDYFHGENIKEMWANISGQVSTCAAQSATGNSAPVANAGSNHLIPRSTPFVLRGSATDVDAGNSLTYCWEQVDTAAATMPPVSTSNSGPAFRSLLPDTSPNRYMPDFATVLTGATANTWEVVPSVARSMDFSLTVRDNVSNGASSDSDIMIATTVAGTGPFIVTSQGSAVTWNSGATELITWNIAGTTGNGINAANVNILMTDDGGATFTTLLSNTPNDGTQNITVPNIVTSTARIIVEGAGNIFYNVNAADITIQTSDFTLNYVSTSQDVCEPNDAVFNFTYSTNLGFSGTTNFTSSGNPAGTTVTFNPTSASVDGTSVTVTVSGITNAMVGANLISTTGTSGPIVRTVDITVNVFSSTIGVPTLLSPINGAIGVTAPYNLSWNADANASGYDIEIATNAAFTAIVETQSVATNSYTATTLVANTQYYWRVRSTNNCATGSWSSVFSFTTASITCNTVNSTDTPLNIPDNSGTGIVSTINIPTPVQITDVNVTVNITHPYDWDVALILQSPNGTLALLTSYNGGSGNNYTNTVFDDAAATNITAGAAPFTGSFQPEEALSAFNSELANGNWNLYVYDLGAADLGTLDNWSIEICGNYNCLMTTSWNGTNWSSGSPPDISVNAILNADYETSVDGPSFEACSLTISPNRTLTIGADDYVRVQNDLTVSNNAFLEIEHEGSLVMVNDNGTITNSGTTNVHKTTPSYAEYDYTYWSSPVIGETIGNVFAANPTNRIYYFNTSNFNDGNNDSFDDEQNDWYNASGTMNPGIGLIAMGQGAYTTPIGQVPYPTYTQSVVFSGEVNNGAITVNVDQDNDLLDNFINQNLIGNPYPSAIDPQLFIQANSTALEGTLYFWTHRTFITASSGPDAYNFTNADYNSYNLSGMVASGAGQATPSNFKIASGQGFFANVSDPSIDVVFNNSMRVNTENNSFYRTNENLEQNRIWLNLIGEGNIFRQLLVAFFDNTTEGYDKLYDGRLLDSGNDYSFYSLIGNDTYVIQAREPFNNYQTIPLGFKITQPGNITISINNLEGVLNDPNTNVIIEDKELNTFHNLKTSDYSFYVNETGVFNDRLELLFDTNTLAIDEVNFINDNLIITESNDVISVSTAKTSKIKSIKIYDLLGRLLMDANPNKSIFKIDANKFNSGTLLIFQVMLETDEILVKKFIAH